MRGRERERKGEREGGGERGERREIDAREGQR